MGDCHRITTTDGKWWWAKKQHWIVQFEWCMLYGILDLHLYLWIHEYLKFASIRIINTSTVQQTLQLHIDMAKAKKPNTISFCVTVSNVPRMYVKFSGKTFCRMKHQVCASAWFWLKAACIWSSLIYRTYQCFVFVAVENCCSLVFRVHLLQKGSSIFFCCHFKSMSMKTA